MDLIWGQSDFFITCLSTSAFYKVFHNDHAAQYGINHMYTVVSQKMQHMSIIQLLQIERNHDHCNNSL